MPTDEEEQERAVFEDDDDDDDDDDTEGDDSEGDHDDGPEDAQAPPSLPQATASAVPVEGLNSAAPIPNPNPIGAAPSDPLPTIQNGEGHVVAVPINAAPSFGSVQFVPFSSPAVAAAPEERKPLSFAFDDSRRLFQRLWTDDEEIKILQSFYEFTSKRGTTFASHQYDTGPFYEDIKKQLQLEFSKNQLIEKLRRLKKKYRNCVGRMRSLGKDFAFKSAHEQAIFDISRKIWSASVERARESDDEDLNAADNINSTEIITVPINEGSPIAGSRRRIRRRMTEEGVTAAAPAAVGVAAEDSTPAICTPLASTAGVPSVIEETVKSCLSPLFKELIDSAISGKFSPGHGAGAVAFNFPLLGLGCSSVPAAGGTVDEKWRKQQILELEVYLKRIELVRDHIRRTLEELKSSGN